MGFSARNLKYMRAFAEAWPVDEIVQAVLAQIPWYHNIALLEKVATEDERLWYARQTTIQGWSRNVLLNQIKANAFKNHKQLPKQHNFQQALPFHLQEQADEMLKSKYNLEFPGITRPILERDFENKLLEKLKQFILELGYGFSFIGNQYRIELNRKEYFVDLLFFHRRLRCLVAIDLKIGDF